MCVLISLLSDFGVAQARKQIAMLSSEPKLKRFRVKFHFAIESNEFTLFFGSLKFALNFESVLDLFSGSCSLFGSGMSVDLSCVLRIDF